MVKMVKTVPIRISREVRRELLNLKRGDATYDTVIRRVLAEAAKGPNHKLMEDFLRWIREPGRVDSWDQEFFDTWVGLYLKKKEEVN